MLLIAAVRAKTLIAKLNLRRDSIVMRTGFVDEALNPHSDTVGSLDGVGVVPPHNRRRSEDSRHMSSVLKKKT